jgi:hypothetical protein
MTKRTYQYRKWLKYLKDQELEDSGFMGLIPLINKRGVHFTYGQIDMETIRAAHDKIIEDKPPKEYY